MTTTLVFAVIFAIVAFLVATWPIMMTTKEERPAAETDPMLADLRRRRDMIYQALRELEFDERVGKISAADFAELNDQYKRRALILLRELDDRQRDTLLSLDQEIEREVARYRRVSANPAPVIAKTRCVGCGGSLAADDRFCRQCGIPVATTCAKCGAKILATDHHCAKCGTRVQG